MSIDLNMLLKAKGIDPRKVIVLRHRPKEPKLAKVIAWLATERPELFNAYQSQHGPRLESSLHKMNGEGYVASFIAHGGRKALFIGLYKISGSVSLNQTEYDSRADVRALRDLGMIGFIPDSPDQLIRWFELVPVEAYSEWKGKLVVDWPPPERAWYRRSENNEMRVIAIQEESLLEAEMPSWEEINLTWEELQLLPAKWKQAMSQWRGIYFIYDESDGKGYVGSAYGEANVFGRWAKYAQSGHGGNKLLKPRDPKNFHFSILQLVSPNMVATDVINLESSWKERLHTREPFGLNNN